MQCYFVDPGTAVIIASSVADRHQRRWERLTLSDPARFLVGALVHPRYGLGVSPKPPGYTLS